MSSLQFVDLSPTESVERAQQAVAEGHTDAWGALDRHLRWSLISHLQNRTENQDALGVALLQASRWADHEEREPWATRWAYLLELLRDADRQPALASELRAVGPEGRAAEMLRILVDHPNPLRPTELVERMGLSIQQISNLGRKLETAGLISRRSSGGKAIWLLPTARGFKLGELLPAPSPLSKEEEIDEAPETSFWQKLDEPVAKIA
ncbi:MAG TPA: MarR family transcriptional regulator [Thermoanaerobaculia bacterium]|nr:MarR family transcriptional regulator [Thermoanaerobaculia bacterium]